MEKLTNDQLVAIVTQGTPMAALFVAANNELLKRLTSLGTKEKIDSLFDIEAIRKEVTETEMLLEKLKKLSGEIGATALNAGSKSLSFSQLDDPHERFADDCKMTVKEGWRIFKGDRELKWSDEDMLNFATIIFFRSPSQAKTLLEDYRNCPKK